MEQVCHRCGETLISNKLYCPHCGAPQLRVEESESVLAAQEGSLQHSLDRVADMMRWRSALVSALLVAVPAALLSSVLSLGALWVFGAGFLAVAMYRRRTASATDGRLGWRIGGVAGAMAATLWLAIEAASMVFERYVMHQGASIDASMHKSLNDALKAMNQQNPALASQYPWFAHFWLSPAGVATLFVTGSCMLALSMVVFSALGGALGGRYLRSRAPRNGAH